MVVRPKKLAPKRIITSRTGVELSECYCRKCMKTKKVDQFFECVDNGFLDANGKFSICKDCCNDIYNKFFDNERSIEKALLKTCRILNIRYDEIALSVAKESLREMIERGLNSEKFFGMYKARLMKTQDTRITDRDTSEDFTFVEPMVSNSNVIEYQDEENPDDARDVKHFWGNKFVKEDYDWLEAELADWQKTHKCDTKAEETLLKEICLKQLSIRKARNEERDVGGQVKQLQDLMKTANVDPAKTAIAGSGKSQDTFSSFIKTIESTEPAEYYKDKKLFKDFDNIDWYFRKYVTRPIKNFITQSRDFNVEQDDGDDDFGEVFEDGDFAPPISQ